MTLYKELGANLQYQVKVTNTNTDESYWMTRFPDGRPAPILEGDSDEVCWFETQELELVMDCIGWYEHPYRFSVELIPSNWKGVTK